MTGHQTFPDGDSVVHEFAPDAPPMDEHGAIRRAISRLNPPESFIPAVHDVRRDAVVAAAVALVQSHNDQVGRIPDKFWPAYGRLADAIDRYTRGGAA